MDFKVEFYGSVLDFDADVITQVPDIVLDRFKGTAIRVTRVVVTKETNKEDS